MNHNQRSAPFTNIGSSSLLVVFLVLCLVTFAVLSLSSARSDDAFSEKLANRKTAYYTAVNRAEDVLACIDTALEQVTSDNATLTHDMPNTDQENLAYHTQNADHTDSADVALRAILALNDAGLPALDGIALTSSTDPDTGTAAPVTDSGLSDDTSPAEPCISFQVPIDDRQHLQVTLEISGNFYEIRTWQTITDTDWESDDSIELLPID